jgi:hypothetical protein
MTRRWSLGRKMISPLALQLDFSAISMSPYPSNTNIVVYRSTLQLDSYLLLFYHIEQPAPNYLVKLLLAGCSADEKGYDF